MMRLRRGICCRAPHGRQAALDLLLLINMPSKSPCLLVSGVCPTHWFLVASGPAAHSRRDRHALSELHRGVRPSVYPVPTLDATPRREKLFAKHGRGLAMTEVGQVVCR